MGGRGRNERLEREMDGDSLFQELRDGHMTPMNHLVTLFTVTTTTLCQAQTPPSQTLTDWPPPQSLQLRIMQSLESRHDYPSSMTPISRSYATPSPAQNPQQVLPGFFNDSRDGVHVCHQCYPLFFIGHPPFFAFLPFSPPPVTRKHEPNFDQTPRMPPAFYPFSSRSPCR
jgi:hypothetical protein